ncbi:MAG TPA: TPM domain-containing protein [Rhizomicrobium sp.]
MNTYFSSFWRAVALAFCFLIAVPAFAAPTFPALTGRVVDNANVLSEQTRADLTQKLEALENQTTRQLVVVTLPSLQGYDIADYGYQLGRAWGIGQKSSNNGVLFIIVPSERKVRIEVGYGLEPILTDALSEIILQSKVLPRFRDGDMEGGIVAGAGALIEQLSLDEPAAKARVAQAAQQQRAVHINPIFLLFAIFFIISIFSHLFRGTRSSGLGWMLPFMLMGNGRSSFGGGGFSSGGGGFSGGGGSFGGGGASGSW